MRKTRKCELLGLTWPLGKKTNERTDEPTH